MFEFCLMNKNKFFLLTTYLLSIYIFISQYFTIHGLSSSIVHYNLKYSNDAGCSYTASWLAHINLYRRISFFVDICRAEAASFEM